MGSKFQMFILSNKIAVTRKGLHPDLEMSSRSLVSNMEVDQGSFQPGCGSKPMGSHFGVGAPPHFRTYFSGGWDVHCGYDLDFDPWPLP